MISEEEVAGGLTEIRELIAIGIRIRHFFEITTALALDHFQKTRCEILVLETGMGGRLDATNAVQSSVTSLRRSISTTRNGSAIPSIKSRGKKQASLSRAFPLSPHRSDRKRKSSSGNAQRNATRLCNLLTTPGRKRNRVAR